MTKKAPGGSREGAQQLRNGTEKASGRLGGGTVYLLGAGEGKRAIRGSTLPYLGWETKSHFIARTKTPRKGRAWRDGS